LAIKILPVPDSHSLTAKDFFGIHPRRRSAAVCCGGSQPAATPSLPAIHPLTLPGSGKYRYSVDQFGIIHASISLRNINVLLMFLDFHYNLCYASQTL
jgi:hypothetical protein